MTSDWFSSYKHPADTSYEENKNASKIQDLDNGLRMR